MLPALTGCSCFVSWSVGVFWEGRREGWYIGGRTAAGEERFLRLGVVKKSEERLSLDRLSL